MAASAHLARGQASSVDVVVPGSANPYLSGVAAGGTAVDGDTAGDPTSTDPNVRLQSPVLVQGLGFTGGSVLTFSGTGAVDYGGNPPSGTPDGGGLQTDGAENGIAGVSYPLNSLVGVFLDDSTPNPAQMPSGLNFASNGNVSGGTDYLTLAPPTLKLKQIFFIGDGLTSTGATQHISVPPGATRLFLGTADGSGWYNNTGGISVHITSAPPALAAPVFDTPKVFTTFHHVDTAIIGDFDGDGVPDVATYSGDYSGGVDVHLGDGSGGFQSNVATFTVADGYAPGGLAGADLDGDGQTELLATTGTSVDIYARQDDGSFAVAQSIDLTASGIMAKKVVVGDLTGSGNQDILVSDYFGNTGLVLLQNDGAGDFLAPVVIPAGGCDYYTRPVLADVNGDDANDVVLSHDGSVGVLLNNGDGTMAAEVDYSNFGVVNFRTDAVTVADVNGDGAPDIIELGSTQDPSTYTNTYYLSVLLNNGDGTFMDGVIFPLPDGGNSVEAADVNDDGQPDILTTDYSKSGFTVTQISGTGTAIAVARQDRFAADGIPYNSMALGYETRGGSFTSFYDDGNVDVLLGSSVEISGSSQFVIFKNLAGLTQTPKTLPDATLTLDGTTADGGPLHVKATQSASNVTVNLQYSLTGLDGSWMDLADGHGGVLASHADGYYFGSTSDTGTVFYPAGQTVYFRAVTSAQGYDDSYSNVLGPYTLKQAQLSISVGLVSTSDTNGLLHVSHVGDDLTYTFTWVNSGASTSATATNLQVAATVPTYIDATSNLNVQFAPSDLTFNQYGHPVAATSATSKDAKVVWNVANLSPGYTQSVSLTIHLGAKVRTDQQIGIGNDYKVYSTTNTPPGAATGYSSGAANVGTTVRGPIKLTIKPDVTTVAPGGFINYTMTIQNLASYTAKNVVIADPAPEFTRFVDYNPKDKSGTAFLNAKGHPADSPNFSIKIGKKSIALNNPSRINGQLPLYDLDAGMQAFLAANPLVKIPSDKADIGVFYVGDLAKNASATVRFTVQVQYTDPANIPDHEIKNFDYLGLFQDSSAHVIITQNDSGNIFTPVQGTVQNAPKLSLIKTISTHLPSPGDSVIVSLAVSNDGPTDADDVFVQDRLPQGLSLLSGDKVPVALTYASSQAELNSAVFLAKSKSSKANNASCFVTLNVDGRTLRIGGLHLEPKETATLVYVMKVPATAAVPQTLTPGPSYVSSGNFSSTALGTSQQGPPDAPIQITGDIKLITYPALLGVTQPFVSSGASTTSAALDALYKKNPNASLLGAGGVPGKYLPGVQRYLLSAQNGGQNTANNVHLRLTLPPNTVFYRASLLKGAKVAKLAKGQSILPPAQLSPGDVTFNFSTLGSGDHVNALVEAIVLPGAVSSATAKVPFPTPVIYTGAAPQLVSKRTSRSLKPLDVSSDSGGSVVYDGHNVPSVGVMKIVPQSVRQGDQFAIQFVIANYGDIDLSDACDVVMQAPAGTQIVGVNADRGFVQSQSATSLDLKFYPIVFGKHAANGMTVTLQATGAAGTVINEDSIVASFPFTGSFRTKATSIQITSAGSSVTNATTTTVSGMQFAGIGEMAVVPLGHDSDGQSQVLVSGPSNLFGDIGSNQAFDVSAVGNGNRVVFGTASAIDLLNLPVVNNSNTDAALAKLATIVAKHGGNIFNGPQSNLLTPDGNLVNNNTGGVLGTIKDMLKKGAVSVVAAGDAAALPAAGSTDVALVGAGVTNAHGAGFVLTQQGGVVSSDDATVIQLKNGVVSNDGGSVVSNDGGSVVSNDGGSVISNDGGSLTSSHGSSSFAQTAAGNFMGAGE